MTIVVSGQDEAGPLQADDAAWEEGLDDDAVDLALAAGAAQALETLTATIPLHSAGERIDRAVARLFPEHSRARIQRWIEDGRLTLDEIVATARTRLRGGEAVRLVPTADPQTQAFAAEPIALAVVHEDADIIVLDKPAGLVVHPAAGNWSGTVLNGLLHRYPELSRVARAGIVHRLDKDTSGLMVVAHTPQAQTDLVRQLQARTVTRRYYAVCWGHPGERSVDAPIGRDPRERTRMAVVPGGKPAVTHVLPLAAGNLDGRTVTLVECKLETGRTHQIRVHLAHLGHPLVGDRVYGARALMAAGTQVFARQALHAHTLAFLHPQTRAQVQWQAAMPGDMRELLARAGIAVPVQR
jgi:23S rRNA pseudouridine1911/1915/1917 synthase